MDDAGHKRLASAILAGALEDLSSGSALQRWQAACFLGSGCCEFWGSVAGYESGQLRRGLQQVQPLIKKIISAGKPE